ncbi:hypothetical protein Drose_19390 [Dactylosporangium roseum]|uniref:Integral membrane protein n=1 Tax=Dactylosporangium roseum TaxID=47989 RepID=A0ABY5YVE0_9ACTN|nr:hypothetical protein [Dactylosporangium roseum]UWZ33482.1 hypothetical protein Drose_19390 [Dactylosporangium roseum]
MQRQTTRTMRPAERVHAVVMGVLGAGLTTAGALALLGVVPIAGSGGGNLAVRLIFGVLFAAIGLGSMAAAVYQLIDGRVTVEPPVPPVDPDDPATDPFHASGLGAYAPGARRSDDYGSEL